MRVRLSEYQKIVWRRTLSSIRTEYGKYALFLIVAEVLSVLLLYLIQWARQSHNVAVQNLTENIFLVVAFNIGLLILIVPWIRFFEIPEDIHNEQAKRIDAFWPDDLDLRVYDSGLGEITKENGAKFPALMFTAVSGEKKKKIVELEGQIDSISQTSIDPNGEAMTLPFFADQRIVWDDGTTITELRPEDRLDFVLGFLDTRDPPIMRFGEGGYANWRFRDEAVYQFSMRFMGKLEGGTEFKRFHYMQVLYADPLDGRVMMGDRAIEIYDIPKEFVKVINVAGEAYWYDYSSPSRRQQEEKRGK